jgi:outer membrane protein TolC
MGAAPATLEGRALANVSLAETEVAIGADATDPRSDAARRSVDAARGRLDLERAARLPALRAGAGLLGYGSGQADPVGEWQAGLSVSWPLFTGGARAAAVRQAELDVQTEEEMLRSIELTIAGELDAADAALIETGARTRALLAAVAQWEEVARIEALSLAEGAGVQQDYLSAEAAVFEARAAHARARYDEVLARVRRTRVQGGLDRDWMNDALEIGG